MTKLIFLLVLCACTPAASAPPHEIDATPITIELSPAATATATATATAIPTATATPTAIASAPPPLDPATCAKDAGTTYATCKWSVAMKGRCGGAALQHEPPPVATCVCNGCETDGDCKARAGGKCEEFAKTCAPRARACVYPGELCANGGKGCATTTYLVPGERAPRTKACYHDGHGHASCGPIQWPPP